MSASFVERRAFAKATPTYTENGPLQRRWIVEGDDMFYKCYEAGKLTFDQEAGAQLFWAGDREVPCMGYARANSSKVLLYCKAQREDIWSCYPVLKRLRDHLKCHVVVWEYPGYGCAPGVASVRSSSANLKLVFDHLTKYRGFAPSDILLMGRSIGTGIAVQFAAQNPAVGALVLLTPFTSIKAVIRNGAGLSSCVGSMAANTITDIFDSLKVAPQLQLPLLIIGGQADKICPASHSIGLFHAATGCSQKSLTVIDGMDHNQGVIANLVEVLDVIRSWLVRENLIIEDTVDEFRQGCLLPRAWAAAAEEASSGPVSASSRPLFPTYVNEVNGCRSVLCRIFVHLDSLELARVSEVCLSWMMTSQSDYLWGRCWKADFGKGVGIAQLELLQDQLKEAISSCTPKLNIKQLEATKLVDIRTWMSAQLHVPMATALEMDESTCKAYYKSAHFGTARSHFSNVLKRVSKVCATSAVQLLGVKG